MAHADFTSSVGIAHNKLLAKVGSARNKPDQQTIVTSRFAAIEHGNCDPAINSSPLHKLAMDLSCPFAVGTHPSSVRPAPFPVSMALKVGKTAWQTIKQSDLSDPNRQAL